MATGFYLLDYNPGTRQWTYPRRGAQLTGTIIVHTAECAMDLEGPDDSAENCARFIANRWDWGSYHRLVDSDSIIKMVPWEYEAWQDSMTNPWAVGISAATQAGKWHTIPADRRDRIYRNLAECGAEFVRYMKLKGIAVPLRRISGAEARARKPGFCAHGDSGVSRSDPGAGFEWDLFFRYVSEALSGTISVQGSIITPAEEEPKDEDDMLIIGQLKGDDAIWIGNGVTRTRVPDLETLASYKWYAQEGWMKIFRDGEVQTLEVISALNALGKEV